MYQLNSCSTKNSCFELKVHSKIHKINTEKKLPRRIMIIQMWFTYIQMISMRSIKNHSNVIHIFCTGYVGNRGKIVKDHVKIIFVKSFTYTKSLGSVKHQLSLLSCLFIVKFVYEERKYVQIWLGERGSAVVHELYLIEIKTNVINLTRNRQPCCLNCCKSQLISLGNIRSPSSNRHH